MREVALATLLLIATPAFAQDRAAWRIGVIGDTQRIPDVIGDPGFTTLRGSRLIATTDSMVANENAIFLVGDIVQQGNVGTCGIHPEADNIEWNRVFNILQGPRLTFEGVGDFDGDCIAAGNPFACCTALDTGPCPTDDWTTLADGSQGPQFFNTPLIAVRGNHDCAATTPWGYNLLYGRFAYSGGIVAAPNPAGGTVPYQYQRPDTYLGGLGDENHAFLIDLGGRRTLVVAMGCGITTEEVNWANAVLRARQHQPAIFMYHIWGLGGEDRSTDAVMTLTSNDGGGTGNCVSTNATSLFNTVVSLNANVRVVLSGHYVDSFVIASCLGDDNPQDCCTGFGTGLCSDLEGAVSVARRSNFLEVMFNWQRFNPENSGGCGASIQYAAAGTIDMLVPYGVSNCAINDAENWDSVIPGTAAMVFDPAPCNMLATERTERTRRTHGCGS